MPFVEKERGYIIIQVNPIVCMVLALNRWKLYSGDQGLKAQHICKITQSPQYSYMMYRMKLKIRQCHLMLNSPTTRKPTTGNSTSSCSMKAFKPKLKGRFWAVRPHSP